ncbi:RNA 2',3'-cyclic phosphodiesterase [Raineyella sp.]|uniref:RNA 2',3'-cyclic phosphodiesterase n=1 Tax=Raineyella sp. TaxID=1911550 RepID=UPI002B1F2BD7|nr:RNA 2',3'-cyclic phosphodiesterase [Raineyella sp.]MEA5154253.1 RNA 2',3'-cyclic phosphodiesterase [Raineyella sp.]
MSSTRDRPAGRRLFLALVPAPAATEVLARWLSIPANGPLPTGWRTTEPDTWHVTLVFMAAVPDAVRPRLLSGFGEVAQRALPLPLTWGHPGAFPRPAAARVAWIGLEDRGDPDTGPSGALTTVGALARACRRAAERVGAGPDRTGFRAHLTLGRSNRPRDLSEHLALPGAPSGPAWVADRMVLVESRPGAGERGRPRYVERADWHLGRPAEDSAAACCGPDVAP